MEYTIYSITCIDEKVKGIYVGSTKDLVKRKKDHKAYSKNEKKTNKLYRCINSNGGISNWEFKILEIFTCETQTEAFIKERLWYDNIEANLNTIRPHRTREEVKEEMKHYYNKHKHKLSEQDKKYRVEKKDKISEKDKQYYILNKVKIASRESEKIFCEPCGLYHRQGDKARHYKTHKHIAKLAKITDV